MPKTEEPIAIDLFCGAGGMSLGFQSAGFNVAAAFDKNPRCVAAYNANFPGTSAIISDLGTTSGKDLRSLAKIGNKHIDVVFGGPPCGGFSVAGQRDPADPRNKLFVHFAEIVSSLMPSYFVVENVRGLVIGEAAKVLDQFRKVVEKAGYVVVWPVKVINAADYGVPQNRERVIILGAKKTLTLPEYPFASTPADGKDRITVREAIGDLSLIERHMEKIEGDEYRGPLGNPSRYARALRTPAPFAEPSKAKKRANGHVLTGCLRVQHSDESTRRFKKTAPGTREATSHFYRLAYDGLAPTLRAGTDLEHGKFTAVRPIHPEHDRCITVREAARLHSFPDWFQFHPTKWHGCMQIGNAVPPFLANAVAMSMKVVITS